MQMTSVLKRYSQIDERVRYFSNLTNTYPSYYTLPNGQKTGFVDIADVSGNGGATVPTAFMKDLGRTIYVHDDSVSDESPVGPRVAILRQVQAVNGPATGGVSGSADNMFNSFWIATWVSGGFTSYASKGRIINLAQVARTG